MTDVQRLKQSSSCFDGQCVLLLKLKHRYNRLLSWSVALDLYLFHVRHIIGLWSLLVSWCGLKDRFLAEFLKGGFLKFLHFDHVYVSSKSK